MQPELQLLPGQTTQLHVNLLIGMEMILNLSMKTVQLIVQLHSNISFLKAVILPIRCGRFIYRMLH